MFYGEFTSDKFNNFSQIFFVSVYDRTPSESEIPGTAPDNRPEVFEVYISM